MSRFQRVLAGAAVTLAAFGLFTWSMSGGSLCDSVVIGRCLTINSDGSINISGTVTANSGVAQNSTTSGQVGPLTQGAVTTSAPSYTTAKTDPISIDTNGNTRVLDAEIALAIANVGSPTTPAVTVQGNASGTPVPISGTVAVISATTGNFDPCANSTKLFADFESGSSGGSIITAASAKTNYICSITIFTSTAANVSLIDGTGSSVCTGGTPLGVYLNTGTTAANGAAMAANGGVQAGNGSGTIAANTGANRNTCVIFTTTNSPQVNVHVSYVQL